MRAPCNLKDEEAAEVLGRFLNGPCLEELEEAQQHFAYCLFYETWGRRDFRECFCENCGRFESERPKIKDPYLEDFFELHHNDTTTCPICGEEVWLVALGRMRNFTSLRQEIKVLFINALDDALYITAGFLNKEYSRDDLAPWPVFVPSKRYYFAPGKRCQWRLRTYNYWGCHDEFDRSWEKRASISEPFPDGYNMGGGYLDGAYHVVGWHNIVNSGLRYCQAQEYFENAYKVDFDDLYAKHKIRGLIPYLSEYTRRPLLEMLIKLGHEDVVTALLDGDSLKGIVNWRAKKPHEFFRLSKNQYKAFAKNAASVKDLKSWKTGCGNLPIDFEQFMWYRGIFGAHLPKFFAQYGEDPRREKIAHWFAGQKQSSRYSKYTQWEDLLRMEQAIGNDPSHDNILMPKNLWQRHDEILPIFNKLQHEREEESARNYGKVRYKELKKRFAYSDGQLSVIVPTCAEEIENEGKALKHCVAGYADRHIKGVRTILFIRWSDDTRVPYLTVELNVNGNKPVSIVQIHGYKNDTFYGQARPSEIHEEFLTGWLDWVNAGSRRSANGKPILPRNNNTSEVKTA